MVAQRAVGLEVELAVELAAGVGPREVGVHAAIRLDVPGVRAGQHGLGDMQAAGVMVLKDGAIVFEDYGLGFGPTGRWTSFSVAKSFTSTLLGAAIADGAIASVDTPVTEIIPALAGTAYDGVSVGQIATMTSGVAWNEDYADPQSDVAHKQNTLQLKLQNNPSLLDGLQSRSQTKRRNI